MTAVQILLAHDPAITAKRATVAAANGMTIEQIAAAEIARGSKAVIASAECRAVLADKCKAMAALDRIAAIDATEPGSSYIPADALIAAILA